MLRAIVAVLAVVLAPVAGAADPATCAGCPELAPIPAGTFRMGSPGTEANRSDDEAPVHKVRIKAFSLMKHEVTRRQFAVFADDTKFGAPACVGYGADGKPASVSWRNPGFEQTDDHPVVCVSWEDGQAYARWLSAKTGKPFRLPTEAEWEYAARAGTTTARYWGELEEPQCEHAKGSAYWNRYLGTMKGMTLGKLCEEKQGAWPRTAPVGTFKPNAFGLFDMLGNVLEHAEDCYHPTYEQAPDDGTARASAACVERVARGGAWNLDPSWLRSARRAHGAPTDRFFFIGLRLASQ